MSNSQRLQDRIETLITQTLPSMRKTRRQNLARLCTGLYQAEHVHLAKIADQLPGLVQQSSKQRRLRRFLTNEAVDPAEWYRPVAERLVEVATQSGPAYVLVDTLELSGRRRLLVAALAYRRRAIPLQWQVDRCTGVTGEDPQVGFIERLAEKMPTEADVVVIGDGEFHSVEVLRAIDQAGWSYCIRIHADTYVRPESGQRSDQRSVQDPDPTWQQTRDLDPSEGERRYLSEVSVTKSRNFGPVGRVYFWAEGEEDPWRLVTNREPDFSVVRLYRKRMWIEELFGDWQEGRFHLHQTGLYAPERLSRLVLGLSLVYVWLVAVASYVVKRGWRHRVDRTDRRDRSYLAIGLRWVRRCLLNQCSLPLRMAPYF